MAQHSESNIVRILLTTDNHLGYMERDSKRAEDSFLSFEECLAAARLEHNCDMMLMGGDLFHENKPSLATMQRTLALFRKYVLGDSPVHLQMLSDPEQGFITHPLPIANFQDPNMNVALPVFMIHGNHDDPVGGTSAIDLLSTPGYVNYFGHINDLDDMVVRPVLLQKGKTRIALYGMGNVRDERLHRCFKLGKVRFVKPKDDKEGWFSILVLHQNRGVRGGRDAKGGIPEEMIAPFKFDVVLWGNEHEQRMLPEPIAGAPSTEIIQPGSSIMTSLSFNESNPKQYGVLMVCGTDYKVEGYNLRSSRPVVRRSVILASERPGKTLDQVEDFLRGIAESMIDEAQKLVMEIPDDVLTAHPNLKYPLMRLAVDFSDPGQANNFPQPNINRFGQEYMDTIVNPGDFLRPIKPSSSALAGGAAGTRAAAAAANAAAAAAGALDGNAEQQQVQKNLVSTNDIRGKIAEVFQANAKDACSMLSEPEVSAAVYAFVEKSEKSAIEEKLEKLVTDTQRHIWKNVRHVAATANGNGSDPQQQQQQQQPLHLGGVELDVDVPTIVDLALGKKQELNKEYYSLLQKEMAAGRGGAAGAGGDDTFNDPVVQELLGIAPPPGGAVGARGGHDVPLGAPLPPNIGADDEDALPGAGAGVGVLNALDVIAQNQQVAPSAPSGSKGKKKAPAAKGAAKKAAATVKRNRDDDDMMDEVLVLDDDGNEMPLPPPAPAPKAKRAGGKRSKAAAAAEAAAPQLQLSTTAPPGPAPTSNAASTLLSKWGK